MQGTQNFSYLQPLMDEILEVRYTDLDRLLLCSQELLRESEAKSYVYGTAFALTYIGDYYIARNNGQEAGPYIERAQTLCLQNNYEELLMNIKIFYGIYYDMILDLLMSLSCTLEALELATKLQNHLRKSVIINNLANIFENFYDMEAARSYYNKALLCLAPLNQKERDTAHYALLIANIVHLSCYFGEVEEAEHYTKSFHEINMEDNDNLGQYYICLCHIAAAKQDLEAFYSLADQILDLARRQGIWSYQFFEILMHIAHYSIEFKNQSYAHQILMVLNELSGERETGHQMRVQKCWVKYYEMFGTEAQQGWAYKRYYKLQQIVDVTNNKAMAAGLHAKIDLHEAAKQQELMIREREELENEAQQDSLTHLYNRRSCTRLIDAAICNPDVKSLGFAMIDVDYFKQYNDSYGHAKGDHTLCEIAQSMTLAAGETDDIYLFRYGGDEFMCMFENCNEDNLETFLKALIAEVRSRKIPHASSCCSNIVSLSIGYSIGQRSADGEFDAIVLLEQADKALYKAKAQGRDRVYKLAAGSEA